MESNNNNKSKSSNNNKSKSSNNNESKSTNNNEFKLSTIYDSYTIPVYDNDSFDKNNQSNYKKRAEADEITKVNTVNFSSGFKFIFYSADMFFIAKNSNYRYLPNDIEYFINNIKDNSSYKKINSIELHIPKNIERHQNLIIQINYMSATDTPKVSYILIKNENNSKGKEEKAPIRLWKKKIYHDHLDPTFMAMLALDNTLPTDVLSYLQPFLHGGKSSKSKRIKSKSSTRKKY